MIKCEFELCIYNDKKKCGLKTIELNDLGLCDSCILPNMRKKDLDKYKKESLLNALQRCVR